MKPLLPAAIAALALGGCARPSAPPDSTASAAASIPAPAPSLSSRPSDPSPSGAPDYPALDPQSHRLCVGGGHTCFVDAQHGLWCWGANSYGQVGNGTHGWNGRSEDTDFEHDTVKRPTRITAVGKTLAVACGSASTCALDVEGAIFCWGRDENPKRLEVLTDVPVPRPIGGRALALALKSSHSCALRADHTLWCWGSNYEGQLGEGPPVPRSRTDYGPATQLQAFGHDVSAVAVSETATCVLKRDATLWCVGKNGQGEFGDGTYQKRLTPVQAAIREPVNRLGAGSNHLCALTRTGTLLCWGRNHEGQLGSGQLSLTDPYGNPTPAPVLPPFQGVRTFDLGAFESLVVDGAGRLFAFGDLEKVVRGYTPSPKPRPHEIRLTAPAVEVGANDSHRCALLADDSLWCWGNGDGYALGNGKDRAQPSPVRVVFAAQ